jgi:His-Xaa-Ser system radical SAM maturase HxsC
MHRRYSGTDGHYHVYSVAADNNAAENLERKALPFVRCRENGVLESSDGAMFTPLLQSTLELPQLHSYDVLEIYPNGIIRRYYDDTSPDNVFLVTERCNSNCVMCPSPENSRKNGHGKNVDQLILLAKHIPSDAKHLTITGGEPFLIGRPIFRFLRCLKERFEFTEFLILTNGRIFALPSFSQELESSLPQSTLLGIPLHASCAALHDEITRTAGSFSQTKAGLKALLSLGLSIEIRIVVSRLNYMDLQNLASFIVKEFPQIDHVCIMGMEMTGNAFLNRSKVWISYAESFPFVANAIDTLIGAGINVWLYNFPLCTVAQKYWTLCRKSISPYKVRYKPECSHCRMQDACGGIFAGTYTFEEHEVNPVL